MNLYNLTKCPNCKEIIIFPYDGHKDEEDTFSVHGWKNLYKAIDMLKKGMSVPEVAHNICGYCGAFLPCGCTNPIPQLTHRN